LSSTATTGTTEEAVTELKKVLKREYVSMFNPMRTEYYAEDVTFDDPLTNLESIKAYQANVDMLGGRTLLGSLLFRDASINLHSIAGGKVSIDDDTESISNIVTRWTLRFTFKILPWSPTARFSGISIYKVAPGGPEGVLVKAQTDYWDSINLLQGKYQKVPKSVALQDFLSQLMQPGFEAQVAAPELPYSLLRRGNGYDVRRYPSFSAVQIPYERRDEGFGTLGAFTKGRYACHLSLRKCIESNYAPLTNTHTHNLCVGMNPLSPAHMSVRTNDDNSNKDDTKKSMMWPLSFAAPGQDTPPGVNDAVQKSKEEASLDCSTLTIPSQVVAVKEYTDASMEPVVRKADAELRNCLARDGLVPDASDRLVFAQYDVLSVDLPHTVLYLPSTINFTIIYPATSFALALEYSLEPY
jgi:hypothetical protein